jgi:general secretion pathway protein G
MEIIKAVLFFGFVSLVLTALLGTPSSGAKIQRVDQDFLVIDNALKACASHAGRPPVSAQGLEALVNEPTTGPKPRRWTQIMTKLPTDPWGTPYRYVLLGPKEREWRWELCCAGPDRVFGNRDDLASEAEWGDYLTLQDGGVESRPSY